MNGFQGQPFDVLIYFVKYPEPGKVKTRLARDVGHEKAAELYRNLVETNLKVLAQVRESFRLILAFDPAQKEREIRSWLEPFQIIDFLPQKGATLGQRLEDAFDFAFSGNAKHVMALGSDTMGLTPQIIKEGFEFLQDYDCVIGPARDGGYYLIGLSANGPAIFSHIPWSTGMVYQSTVQYLEREELTYYKLPELEDLDEIKNLKPAWPAGKEACL